MYDTNTIPVGLQTKNLVAEESNPEILKAKQQELEELVLQSGVRVQATGATLVGRTSRREGDRDGDARLAPWRSSRADREGASRYRPSMRCECRQGLEGAQARPRRGRG